LEIAYGKALFIDLGSGIQRMEILDEAILRKYIGGS